MNTQPYGDLERKVCPLKVEIYKLSRSGSVQKLIMHIWGKIIWVQEDVGVYVCVCVSVSGTALFLLVILSSCSYLFSYIMNIAE